MARSKQHCDGFRHASRRAVAILHEEAQRMNDPARRQALDSAAFMLGARLKRELGSMTPRAPQETK